MMNHVILLGDSIFDNAAYVDGGPAVITQVRERLPQGWQATLLAVDGSIIGDVPQQLERLPADASHIIVSAGGNDALGRSDLLGDPAQSVAEVLQRLAVIAEEFERNYRRMLEAILGHNLATTLCTIYYPAFPDPLMQRLAVTGLTVFNDCIIRAAIGAGLPLLDLRLICNSPTDYANPIEPSAVGGAKIAAVITHVVTQHDFAKPRTTVFFE
jgi:hypothetical protein